MLITETGGDIFSDLAWEQHGRGAHLTTSDLKTACGPDGVITAAIMTAIAKACKPGGAVANAITAAVAAACEAQGTMVKLSNEEQGFLESYRKHRDARQGTEPPKEDQDELTATCRKMLRMGLPLAAVRHKLERQNIAQNIVDDILSRLKNNPSLSTFSPKDETIVTWKGIAEKKEETERASNTRLVTGSGIAAMAAAAAATAAIATRKTAARLDSTTSPLATGAGIAAIAAAATARRNRQRKAAENVPVPFGSGGIVAIAAAAAAHKERERKASQTVSAPFGRRRMVAVAAAAAAARKNRGNERGHFVDPFRHKKCIANDAVLRRPKTHQDDKKNSAVVLGRSKNAKVVSKSQPKPQLNAAEGKVAFTYRILLKAGYAPNEVKNFMKKDGIDSRIAPAVVPEECQYGTTKASMP